MGEAALRIAAFPGVETMMLQLLHANYNFNLSLEFWTTFLWFLLHELHWCYSWPIARRLPVRNPLSPSLDAAFGANQGEEHLRTPLR